MYINVHSEKVYSLRNIYATNIPKGVGADSLRPYHQQKQLVVICKILRIAMLAVETRNTISGIFVDTGTINRSPTPTEWTWKNVGYGEYT